VTFTGHTIINQPIVRVSPLYGRKPLGVFPEMSIVDTADGVQHFIGAAGTTDVDATNSTAFIVLNGVAGTESDRGEIYLGVTAVNLFTTPAVGTVITAHYHNTANSKFWELCYVNRPYLQGRTA
jgi:hypothetical protein